MDARCLVRVGVGVLLVLAGCGQVQPGGEPSPTLSLDWEKMEQQRIAASQRAEARASASATASPTSTGPYVWKEIPEPTLPPEAQAQAGFAEAELAAKYFVELQYYVAQTNDLATWEQVVSPESNYANRVSALAIERQELGVRLGYEGLAIESIKVRQGAENSNRFQIFLIVRMSNEYVLDTTEKLVAENGEKELYFETYVEFYGDAWKLVGAADYSERPEGLD